MIRDAAERDAGAILSIYAPFISDGAVSFEVEVPGVEEMAGRVRKTQERYAWLVWELEGTVVGYAYGSPHRARAAYQWCVEVSVYVVAGARRRGVARALYATLFERLRRQGYVNAYAAITLPNPASVRFHAAMGFTPVGVFDRIGFKLGAWHDVGWYQLRLQEVLQPVAPGEAKG